MTVGSGIAPDLLTLPRHEGGQALAGWAQAAPSPPVGNCTPPWERRGRWRPRGTLYHIFAGTAHRGPD